MFSLLYLLLGALWLYLLDHKIKEGRSRWARRRIAPPGRLPRRRARRVDHDAS